MLLYAALRILLLLASGGALFLLGTRGWLLAVTAIIMAAMLSYILLPRSRHKAAGSLATVAQQHQRVKPEDTDEEIEDAAVDVAQSAEAEADGGLDEHRTQANDDPKAEL